MYPIACHRTGCMFKNIFLLINIMLKIALAIYTAARHPVELKNSSMNKAASGAKTIISYITTVFNTTSVKNI